MHAPWLQNARLRARAGRQRLGTYLFHQPWVARAAMTAVLIASGLVALLLLLAVLVVALPIFLIALMVAAIRTRLGRARAPNGPPDGRRNVRVIVRESSP